MYSELGRPRSPFQTRSPRRGFHSGVYCDGIIPTQTTSLLVLILVINAQVLSIPSFVCGNIHIMIHTYFLCESLQEQNGAIDKVGLNWEGVRII